jgi:PleD family two-component response regulator
MTMIRQGVGHSSAEPRGRALTERPFRILVADDHSALRRGVCTLLRSRDDMEVCGEAENGKEAIEKTQELEPDLMASAQLEKLESLCPMLQFSYSPCTEANGLFKRPSW